MPSRRLIARAVTAILTFIVLPFAAVHYYHQTYAPQTGMMSAVPKPAAQHQIVVVGAGLAGLAAAHAALTASPTASVLLLERAAKPGGNSIKASSGINGVPTRFQKPGLDSADRFRDDTTRSAGARLLASSATTAEAGLARPAREALIARLADRSADAVHWLHDTVGVDLSVVAQLGGHSAARTHRGAGKTPPGFAIISALLAQLNDGLGKGRFELRTGCEVTRLLTPSEGPRRVGGVEFSCAAADGDGDSKSSGSSTAEAAGPVVFATGGFAGDAGGLLARHRPDLGPLPSTNDAAAAVGLAVLARDAAAAMVDMDSVQVHPTGFVDPARPAAPVKILAAELLRGEGGILLRGGARFVNEMETREHVSAAVMAAPAAVDERAAAADGGEAPPRQWDVQLLLDPGACEASASHIGFYVFKGLMRKQKVRDLDEATRRAVRDYGDVVAGRKADPFGRTAFGHWRLGAGGEGESDYEDAEVCVGRVTPITHFTMGGAAINDRAQVLGAAGAPVEGLWAAGEVTGGLHGDNRLGGSSLLECVVFGRVAGEEAARYVQSI
ncbi:hypothetical protein GGTG_10458 [Gaeumannomyces tritici R3-111a-1]|uniref:Fumarate reductase n=1 Tax=Gaeumannomyces tritici (strain R3-111a-1) TaxID=644352 RepID=J3PAD2_GAET3|nr:hypothetical protein GGTG_10458 [Gaeumannomyces tritici R3-111a-1]EJT71198.1 hypothetical protein GGTG_10458 [Gaeumannomyces tritici R3-111a-1]